MNSKGWKMMSQHLSNLYLEAEKMVTAETIVTDKGVQQVSNSVRLENANKMAIVKKVIYYPSAILETLQG